MKRRDFLKKKRGGHRPGKHPQIAPDARRSRKPVLAPFVRSRSGPHAAGGQSFAGVSPPRARGPLLAQTARRPRDRIRSRRCPSPSASNGRSCPSGGFAAWPPAPSSAKVSPTGNGAMQHRVDGRSLRGANPLPPRKPAPPVEKTHRGSQRRGHIPAISANGVGRQTTRSSDARPPTHESRSHQAGHRTAPHHSGIPDAA